MLVTVSGCANGAAVKAQQAQTRVDQAKAAQRATKRQAKAKADAGCQYIVAHTEKRTTPAPEDLEFLIGATVTSEPCWDRITFVFEPTGAMVPPGYEVEYRDPSTFVEANGGRLPTLGDAFLHVTFTPAQSYDRRNSRVIQKYLGNTLLLIPSDVRNIKIVAHRDDGDGTVQWFIGLDSKRPFTVDAASNPPRVSVLVMK